MSSLPNESAFSGGTKTSMRAAVATWTFGALAVEECVSYLLNGCSALDAVEKGINKV
jgi:isoaspartyl peptidase/L-asparaginase-like protein (Ntn-hydrolase superfamily)